ncbi:MAG: peptidoglycan DD-metalloendopeptidase family protein [Bacteroides sp.]|nr:peptidoglycan DD-metalloendopeptidase family protein [Bacteroides sp.]
MNRYISALSLSAVLTLIASCYSGNGENPVNEEIAEETVELHRLGFDPDTLTMESGAVHNGEFFSNLMSRLGLSHEQSYCLAQASDSVFNVRKLRAGNAWSAYYSVTRENEEMQEKRLEYVVYGMDRVTDVVFKCVEPYRVWISEKPVETGRYTADVTINSSLWNDMRDAGVSPLLILQLSDIYAWTVDFFGLQKGDRFKVIYDMALCEGEAVAVDTVRYAVFEHAGTEYPAIMFNQGDGGNIYWNGNGESLRKAFLKAPLRYSRISSGFSYSRKHPVTRKVQPHTGIDYAAPAGTPVMTIGDGTVTSIGYEGAGGNVVRIRHNSVYSTAYLHLSKFASGLKVGQRVAQGDVIGYVGATGRCTGPHLDFRVWKNGSPVNPLKMESPPAEPLRTENKAAFDSLYIALREMWHDSQK